MSLSHRLLGLMLALLLTMSSAVTALAQDADSTPDPDAVTEEEEDARGRFGTDATLEDEADEDATPTGSASGSDVPQIGDAVTIYDENGVEIAAITVENVTDPYDEFSEYFSPDEGARYLAVDLTIQNLVENDRFEFSPWDLSIMTAEGFLIGDAYVSLPDDSDIVELESTDVLGGESIEGTAFFAVPENAELNGVYFNDYGYLVQLADLSDGAIERPAIGDTVTTVNTSGEEVAEITIVDINDDFTEVSEYFTIERGTRIIAVTIHVENLVENDRYEVSPYDFALQTEEGYLLSTGYVSLPDDTDIVELESTDVLGGESVEGTIFFVIPDDIEIGGFYFQPESGLVFLIGDPAA